MNNDRGNIELMVNVPLAANFETFKHIIQEKTNQHTEEGLKELYEIFVKMNEHDKVRHKGLLEIVGELFDDLKGKTDANSLKKMKEIEDVANYLYDLKMKTDANVSIVSADESPDFIIEINGERIGLEHTLYVDDNVVAKISTIRTAFSLCQKNFISEHPGAKMLLNVTVNLDHVPNKNDLVIQSMPYFKSLIDNKEIQKPPFINKVICSAHETFQVAYNEECVPTKIDIENFEAKIDAKDAKIARYRAQSGLHKINLLVVMEGYGCRSNFNIDLALLPKKKRQFDEIVIYNQFEQTILVGKMDVNR